MKFMMISKDYLDVVKEIIVDLERWYQIYIKQGKRTKKLSNNEIDKTFKLKTCIDINIFDIYDSFLTSRYSERYQTFSMKFSNKDQAHNFARNILENSEIINSYYVVNTEENNVFLMLKCNATYEWESSNIQS